MSEPAPEPQELTVAFVGRAREVLLDLARRKKKSIEDVVEDALSLEEWHQELREMGATVIVEYPDGSLKQLVRS